MGEHGAPAPAGELLVAPELGFHPGQHLRVVEGLGDEVVRPQPEHVDPVLQARLGGEDDDGHGLLLAHLGDEFLPCQAREHQIQQHQIVLVLSGPQGGLAARKGRAAGIARPLQDAAEQLVDIGVILDHQNVADIHSISPSVVWPAPGPGPLRRSGRSYRPPCPAGRRPAS